MLTMSMELDSFRKQPPTLKEIGQFLNDMGVPETGVKSVLQGQTGGYKSSAQIDFKTEEFRNKCVTSDRITIGPGLWVIETGKTEDESVKVYFNRVPALVPDAALAAYAGMWGEVKICDGEPVQRDVVKGEITGIIWENGVRILHMTLEEPIPKHNLMKGAEIIVSHRGQLECGRCRRLNSKCSSGGRKESYKDGKLPWKVALKELLEDTRESGKLC